MSLSEGELLAVVRVGGWRCAIPLVDVVQVLSAAMPVKVPRGDGAAYAVRLGQHLAPVIFGAALFGATAVELRLADKMVVLRRPTGDCVLWVDSVEDLAPYVPLPERAGVEAGRYVTCFSGGAETVAVLDLDEVALSQLHG